MEPDQALLIVDVQNDFCPGGALAVPGGDCVVPVLNRCIERFTRQGNRIFASRDWHPALTRHFKDHGGPWPPHCVAGTPGAEFHPKLRLPQDVVVVSKGQEPGSDGYSAFEGVTLGGQKLSRELKKRGIRRLVVGGLATDYCVKHSVLDALAEGLEVLLLTDAVAGVDVEQGDSERALEQMRRAGARLVSSEDLG